MLLAIGVLVLCLPASARADDEVRSRYDLAQVQGILAVQQLDGWLLTDRAGQNSIAVELVNPDGPRHRWFYLIPSQGQPKALVHRRDARKFRNVPGDKLTYTNSRNLVRRLRKLLRGVKTVAMEYAPKSAIASLSRVDGGTVELIKARRVQIRSSAQLVQFTKALWGPKGRIAHYIAAHHLEMLTKQALAEIAAKVRAGSAITELDVQKLLIKGFKVRGISGPAPVVASGPNTADADYTVKASSARLIKRGDLVLIAMSARVDGSTRPIYADTTWMAYVGDRVPEKAAKAFSVVAKARDAALGLIKDRLARRRAVKGFEADRAARAVIGTAGWAGNFTHPTGHSLDTSVEGDGANLDSYTATDRRVLVMGSGFTIEPGVYFKGGMGVRTEIDVYIGRKGVEVTTPVQASITPLL